MTFIGTEKAIVTPATVAKMHANKEPGTTPTPAW
jgi:hypothetical protein